MLIMKSIIVMQIKNNTVGSLAFTESGLFCIMPAKNMRDVLYVHAFATRIHTYVL